MNTLHFTPTHEWLQSTENEVIIGITDHAQELLGDLVFIELPEIGQTIQAGDELGVVESVKAASDFYAPISGVVTAVNTEVVTNPAIVNTKPYTDGWLVKINPRDTNEIKNLLTQEQYEKTIAEGH